MKKLLPTTAILIAAITGGCGQPGSDGANPLPRRYAYPRFEPYDTSSVIYNFEGLNLRINAQAKPIPQGQGWLDLSFPRYGATVHLTYTHNHTEASISSAIKNRKERMDLNLGEAEAYVSEYKTGAGFSCLEIIAADALVTPVQFLAVDNDGRMLSGACVLAEDDAPADSIRPVVEAIADEVRRMLTSLSTKK